ncbi:MAG: hypothetical protein P8X74_20650 [Reinekea sp.]
MYLTFPRIIRRSLLCVLIMTSASIAQAVGLIELFNRPQPIWGFLNNVEFYQGYLYTRGIYYTPEDANGNRFKVYVEYDEDGLEVSEIGINNDQDSNDPYYHSFVVSGPEYNGHIDRYKQTLAEFKANHATDLEPELLTVAEYKERKRELQTQTEWGIHSDPTLKSTTRSVLVQPEALILTPTSRWLLAEFPFDFTDHHEKQPDGVKSLLIDQGGKILNASEHHIGFRAIYYEDLSKSKSDNERYNPYFNFSEAQRTTEEELSLTSPVQAVTITASMPLMGGGTTNEKGHYGFSVRGEPCPMTAYTQEARLQARIPYRAFNPDRPGQNHYTAFKTIYFTCDGLYSLNHTPSVTYLHAIDFPIDVNILTGDFAFKGVTLANASDEIKLEYDFKGREPEEGNNNPAPDPNPPAVASRFTNVAASNTYDFDLDGDFDLAICGVLETMTDADGNTQTIFVPIPQGTTNCAQSTVQGIYLTSQIQRPYQCLDADGNPVNGDPACQPQFTRVIDTETEPKDIGLVKKMASEHVQDTDLYIIRQSTGQLVAMRQGLRDSEGIY